jgi:hypothetical protein
MLIPILTPCETVTIGKDGTINIIGAYWLVRAKSAPLSHSISIAIQAFFAEHEGTDTRSFEVRIIDPDGKSIGACTFKQDMQFRLGVGFFPAALPLEVNFQSFGEYAVVAIVDNKWQARTPLIVEKQ